MKVTQEKLPASQMGLEIEIPSEMSKKAYEKVIQEFTRAANIPGFRKGKIPRQVLLQRFGPSRIKAAALEDLIQQGIKQAIEQEKIEAIGNYQLRSSFDELVGRFEPDQPLTFSAAVDVQPEVKLSQYTGLTVKAEEIKPDPEQVDKVLEERRQEMATLIPVEGRAAQLGDVAIVDFEGLLVSQEEGAEPEPVPGGQAENFQVELAEGRFIPGFVDGIVGMQPGETKEVQAQFPEAYPQPDVAGRAAVFTVTLRELKEKEPPELDDDFAQDISEFETLAELRTSLETRFQEDAERRTASNKEQALLDELLNHIEVDLPETLIEREVDYLLTQTAMQLQNQGIDYKRLFTKEIVPGLRQRSRDEAISRIKRTLALGEIAKRESLQVEPEKITARVTELMEQYKDQAIDAQRLQDVVSEDLLKEKIIAWLEEHSTVELVPEGTLSTNEQEETTAELSSQATQLPEPEPQPASTQTIDVAAETMKPESSSETP